MELRSRRLWKIGKFLLGVTIVGGVGWQFARILSRPDLWQQSAQLRPAWVAASAALYLLALGFSVFFWYWLLRTLGQEPAIITTIRAYYIGQLGKYAPGKVWGLFL